MFKKLNEINTKPAPFQFYTAEELWTNEHTSKQMLKYHMDENIDAASWNKNLIEKSVRWMASYFKLGQNSKIADFGCGPGQYTSRLAKLGAKVTGIDFSENSINYAKKVAAENNLDIHYTVKNYLEFETRDRFDLIIMIMCDFCALSPEQRRTLLAKYQSFLKPSGSVLLDVHTFNFFDQKKESAGYEKNQLDGFWSADDYYCFVNCYKYEDEKVTLDKYTIFEESGERVVYNWLQYFNKESIVKEFECNGFTIESIFSDIAGQSFEPESPYMAVVAKKA